jgi:peptide chain release factor 1
MRLYHKFSASRGLACSTEREKEGDILLRVEGENALNAFSRESGKNVVQRVPQTEKAGRRQTSLVSVAVLPLPESERFEVLDSEIEIFTKRGSGPGGQHRNKTESCVVARHIPTGVEVKIDGRKQGQNRIVAVQELSKRVRSVLESARKRNYDELRSSQMGCQSGEAGGRGEKIRTYNFIDSRCVDHRSGKLTRDLKSIMNGSLELVL